MGELFDATGQMGKQGAFQAGHSIESKKCSERKVKYYYALKGGHPIPYHHTRSSKHYQLHPKVTKGGRLDPPLIIRASFTSVLNLIWIGRFYIKLHPTAAIRLMKLKWHVRSFFEGRGHPGYYRREKAAPSKRPRPAKAAPPAAAAMTFSSAKNEKRGTRRNILIHQTN